MHDPIANRRTALSEERHRQAVLAALLDEATFRRLTASRPAPGAEMPWHKATVRPVEVQGRRLLQFSYSGDARAVTRNHAVDEVALALDELLELPFTRLHVQRSTGDLHIRITKRGRVLMSHGKPSLAEPAAPPDLSPSQTKASPLDPGDPFLQAIGVTGDDGRIKTGMAAKHHQIKQFLQVIEQTVPEAGEDDRPLRLVDCGCGRAYLTFAACHYLREVMGRQVEVTGIDLRQDVIDTCRKLVETLGWPDLDFHVARIADHRPLAPPDMVLSLHACDTATDEAIALGVAWQSQVILAAPCCQHELHQQLESDAWRPLLRHGILKERLADLLTDAFRAHLLRIMGYRTRVIEFVDAEHTAKNLMIRAVSGLPKGQAGVVKEYLALRDTWGVTPCLETLLGDALATLLSP